MPTHRCIPRIYSGGEAGEGDAAKQLVCVLSHVLAVLLALFLFPQLIVSARRGRGSGSDGRARTVPRSGEPHCLNIIRLGVSVSDLRHPAPLRQSRVPARRNALAEAAKASFVARRTRVRNLAPPTRTSRAHRTTGTHTRAEGGAEGAGGAGRHASEIRHFVDIFVYFLLSAAGGRRAGGARAFPSAAALVKQTIDGAAGAAGRNNVRM